MTIARSPRLVLRQLRIADADALDGVLGDAEVMRFGEGTKTPAQVRQWVNRWIDNLYPQWG